MKSKNKFLLAALILLGLLVINRHLIRDAAKYVYRSCYSYLLLSNVEIETIQLLIKDADWKKIELQRDRAFEEGYLLLGKKDRVPCNLISDGDTLLGNIRLKGDYLDHLKDKKWSFRVDLLSGELNGMDKFSLHHPGRRNNVYELLYHLLLEQEGIMHLNYSFPKLIINGEDYGIYGMEEHFGSSFLPSRRLNGFVVRFDEDQMWREYAEAKEDSLKNKNEQFHKSVVDAYQTKTIKNDSLLNDHYDRIIQKLIDFRSGKLPASDVFEIKQMSSFFALSDLLSAQHGISWHNARYYYDPNTKKLSPIGFDGEPYFPLKKLAIDLYDPISDSSQNSYIQLLFNDSLFKLNYIEELKRFSNKAYIKSILPIIQKQISDNLTILKSEFPGIDYSEELIYKNQEIIEKRLTELKSTGYL